MPSNYHPGAVVENIADLCEIGETSGLFFMGKKPNPINWAFLQGLPLRVLIVAIRAGNLRVAVRNPEVKHG